MSTYVPVAAPLGNITLPADGENIDAIDVNAPFQSLADGLAHATAIAGAVAALADLTALAAVLAPADGAVRHVVGYGWYVFKTSATTGLSPFRVAAGDFTVGGWVASIAHETTKAVTVPCNRGVFISTDSAGTVASQPPNVTVALGYANTTVLQATISDVGFYPLIVQTGGASSYLFAIPIDEFMIDGATLASAHLYLRPKGGHAGLPTRQPWLGIVRNIATGYAPVPQPLLSGVTGVSQLASGSTGAYQTDNTIVLTCDQNNVIDKLQYNYLAIIGDEGGTNALAGNRFAKILLNFTGIPDARRA